MPQTFVVDQAATFAAIAFLQSNPKMQFGTQIQDKTTDGIPKWDIELVGSFRNNFGKVESEVLKIGVAALKNPGEGMGMYTPVQLVNFVVGVMDKKTKDKETGQMTLGGAQVWYRADEIRPLMAAPAGKS